VLRRAYAKINLALSVGPLDAPRRMHPIESWMHCIDLYDEVHIEPRKGENRGSSRRPARGSEIETVWASDAPRPSEVDWGPEEDLGVRALRVLEAHTHESLAVHLRIVKRIPVGGGLGGGSSNAATVLLAANELFGLGLSRVELARLSRSIGSDVAFFVDEEDPPRPAFVRGYGDEIERRDRAQSDLVLIMPPFGCPTREVYAAFDSLPSAAARERNLASLRDEEGIISGNLFNDLAAAAESVHPALAGMRARVVAATSRPVHMSGSGSTLFVLTDDPEDTVQKVAIAAPDAAIVRTKLV
jgi:4-diphosphocytidyl-2-C-methyl-D-erythritol kinase